MKKNVLKFNWQNMSSLAFVCFSTDARNEKVESVLQKLAMCIRVIRTGREKNHLVLIVILKYYFVSITLSDIRYEKVCVLPWIAIDDYISHMIILIYFNQLENLQIGFFLFYMYASKLLSPWSGSIFFLP